MKVIGRKLFWSSLVCEPIRLVAACSPEVSYRLLPLVTHSLGTFLDDLLLWRLEHQQLLILVQTLLLSFSRLLTSESRFMGEQDPEEARLLQAGNLTFRV